MAPDDDDKRVKDLLGGPTSLADLQRWFGLPSFQQLSEEPPPPEHAEDPGVKAVREQRAKAIAAVDPGLLAAIDARHETAWGLIQFEAVIDVRVDVDMPFYDAKMVDRLAVVAEPRERERPEDIEDDLKDRTPQALLRDLHRVETFFDKTFELFDAAAEQTLDIVAEVKSAMATSWKLPALGDPPSVVIQKVASEVRAERTLPWSAIPSRAYLPNRRITDEGAG